MVLWIKVLLSGVALATTSSVGYLIYRKASVSVEETVKSEANNVDGKPGSEVNSPKPQVSP